MNKLQICKGAFILAGMNPINNLEANTMEAIIVNNRYDSVVDKLLSEGYWDFAIKQTELNKDTEEGDYEFKNKFLLPSDFIRMNTFLYTDEIDKPRDFKIIGNKILTNNDRLFLEYVARVDESLFPSHLRLVLEYDLAGEIVYSLTEDKTKSRELKAQAELYLQRAKELDLMNSGSQSLWNSKYLKSRSEY